MEDEYRVHSGDLRAVIGLSQRKESRVVRPRVCRRIGAVDVEVGGVWFDSEKDGGPASRQMVDGRARVRVRVRVMTKCRGSKVRARVSPDELFHGSGRCICCSFVEVDRCYGRGKRAHAVAVHFYTQDQERARSLLSIMSGAMVKARLCFDCQLLSMRPRKHRYGTGCWGRRHCRHTTTNTAWEILTSPRHVFDASRRTRETPDW